MSKLMKAIRSGDVERLKDQLQRSDPNEIRTPQGFTALMVAVEAKNRDAVSVLLEAGADIDARSRREGTALGLAAETGQTSMVELLLVRGASANPQRDDHGTTPLIEALRNGDLETAELLLDHGSDPTFLTVNRDTALHAAVFGTVSRDQIEKGLPIIRRILERGASPNQIAFNGRTPLMIAAYSGHERRMPVIELLLAHGADIKTTNAEGKSALDYAQEGPATSAAVLALLS